MPDATAHPPQRHKRAIWLKIALFAIAFALVCIICVDYSVFHNRWNCIRTVVGQLGGKGGSIGDWPMCLEYVVTFNRPLTDAELQRLATLVPIHQMSRFHIMVMFRNCHFSKDRENEMKKMLQDMPVHFSEDDEQDHTR